MVQLVAHSDLGIISTTVPLDPYSNASILISDKKRHLAKTQVVSAVPIILYICVLSIFKQ